MIVFSSMSNNDIDEILRNIKQNHPAAGERMIMGHLRARNVYLQRHRVRQSLKRIDAAGISARSLTTIQRRQYFAPSPNYIWHIDGTHKLVRWKFVVHMGVDGFSRLIVYCKCSPNNKASTVLQFFQQAEQQYGLPLRVRSDFGGENAEVWHYMYRSQLNLDAVIKGSSVHNQRVERLNRDVNNQVINYFVNLFTFMEQRNILNPDNELDLYALHVTFLSRINEKLSEFVQAWNCHPLSTAGNLTPQQLHATNLRLLQLQFLNPLSSINESDVDAPSRVSSVEVEPPQAILLPNEQSALAELVTLNSSMKQIQLFKLISEFINSCVSSRELVV